MALQLDQPQRELINECWIEDPRNYFVGSTEDAGQAKKDLNAHRDIRETSRQWLAVGIVLTGVLMVVALGIAPILHGPLLFFVPTVLTISASFALYAHTRACEAHAHSYSTMGRLFAHAGREAQTSDCRSVTSEYQRLIVDLGREALAENTDWLKDHRSRPIAHEMH